jgi:hypothetical protein
MLISKRNIVLELICVCIIVRAFLLGSSTLVPPHVLFVSCEVVATWFLRFLIWLQSFVGDGTDTVFSRERKKEKAIVFLPAFVAYGHIFSNFTAPVKGIFALTLTSQLATGYRHIHKSHGEKRKSIISATICNGEMAIRFSLCMNRTTLLYLNCIVPLPETLLLNYLLHQYLNCYFHWFLNYVWSFSYLFFYKYYIFYF